MALRACIDKKSFVFKHVWFKIFRLLIEDNSTKVLKKHQVSYISSLVFRLKKLYLQREL